MPKHPTEKHVQEARQWLISQGIPTAGKTLSLASLLERSREGDPREDTSLCPMCGRNYDDHPACKACDSPKHDTDDCPLVKNYDEGNRRGDL